MFGRIIGLDYLYSFDYTWVWLWCGSSQALSWGLWPQPTDLDGILPLWPTLVQLSV